MNKEKTPVILGLKVTNHDTGAALIAGQRLVAIAEERLNRVKHSRHYFPRLAINYCLAALGVRPEEVQLVVLDQVRSRRNNSSLQILEKNAPGKFPNARVVVINHHDAHAASAFFASPFDTAAVMVVDGAGESVRDHLGVLGTETETLYRGFGNQLEVIQKTVHARGMTGFPFTIGIGKLYSFISNGYLNFGDYNEGKMMGLAPYGSDALLKKYPLPMWFKSINNHFVCNPRIVFPGLSEVKGFRGKYEWRGRLLWLWEQFFNTLGYFAFKLSRRRGESFLIKPQIFQEIVLEKPRRRKNDPLPTPAYADAAYAVQKVLEEVMVAWGKKIKNITGEENLCVSGGVALNIDANKRFLDDVGFRNIFIQPAASDTGIALGCALWGAHQILGLPRFYEMRRASLGRSYTTEEIQQALAKESDRITIRSSTNIAVETAKLIAQGKIVGWFSGGAEYGPRALGNRSIICDARDPKMKDIVNEKVKHRESWRPFAASVLAEKQREWFELDYPSPFMLLAAKVPPDKQKLIPSVVHVDGTCRIQAVTAEANRPYYELLRAFEQETGVPLFLNTSFNDAGEPIVETPTDALRCFLNTQMDYLVLENYLVTKK
jgi:carbamoyltransferase